MKERPKSHGLLMKLLALAQGSSFDQLLHNYIRLVHAMEQRAAWPAISFKNMSFN